MKIATFNVNGVNGRLPLLLDWLAEAEPDVACLQELKAPDEKFPRSGDRKGGLWCDLARPEPLERRRHPRPRLRAGRDPSRPARRSGGHAQPLYRGGGRRRAGRLPLSAQRQPDRDAQVRLQAEMDGALHGPRRRAGRARLPGRARRRLQRHPDRRRRLQARALARRRLVPARAARPISPAAEAGLDRRDPPPPSRTRRSSPSGIIGATPSPATPASASTTCCSTRSAAKRLEAAGVDTRVRAREKASDHAPVWAALNRSSK